MELKLLILGTKRDTNKENPENIQVRESQEDSDEKICVPGFEEQGECLVMDIEAVEKLASGIE